MNVESLKNLNIAFSHDWLTGMRGGERVLETLCSIFPHAPVYTLFYNKKAISDIINKRTIKTSFLQYLPGIFSYYRNFLPLFPLAVKTLGTPEADIIISLSHCVAKGIPTNGKIHLCYCFTPMRYAWLFHNEYFGNNPLRIFLIKPLIAFLQKWDIATARQVTKFIAISKTVRDRIYNFYGVKADVIYPPVNTDFYTPGEYQKAGNFDLIVSAFVPYKRIDLAVKAYTQYGYSLKIVGKGPQLKKLQRIASSNIEFLGWRSDEEIRELYRKCRLLVFPGEEDFGIVPVEAQACGKPVVAFGKGGLLETIIDGKTGVFFYEQNPTSLINAVKHCSSLKFSPQEIRQQAEKFSKERFINEFCSLLLRHLK